MQIVCDMTNTWLKGCPSASGSVEGACKNLIKDRMERSGMRWTMSMTSSGSIPLGAGASS